MSRGVLISRAALPTAPPRAGGRDVLADSGSPSDPKAHGGPQVPREFHLAVGKTRRPVEEENAFGGESNVQVST